MHEAHGYEGPCNEDDREQDDAAGATASASPPMARTPIAGLARRLHFLQAGIGWARESQ